jgi:hypothetical protein
MHMHMHSPRYSQTHALHVQQTHTLVVGIFNIHCMATPTQPTYLCISISAPVCPVRASAYPPRQPQIYITVSDWNKMSKADVVGHASISAQQLHRLLIKEPAEISSHSVTAGPAEEVELTLVDTHGKPVGDRVFAR